MSANPHPYHKGGRMAPPPKDIEDSAQEKKPKQSSSKSSQKVTRPKPNKNRYKSERPEKKKSKVLGTVTFIVILLGALYLLLVGFCALKFNSLNPFRTLDGVTRVLNKTDAYYQVADFPYEAYVADPETSVTNLMAKMEAEGYTYEELESTDNNFIFGKDTARVRVVVSGNDKFSRWVFSEISQITIVSDSDLDYE